MFHFNPPPPQTFPSSFSLSQSPSIWVSKSGRAPAPPMQLGCEGAERAGSSRGGTGSPWGGAGLRLPGAPGWSVPPLLHTRCCRLPGSIRGWSRPPAYRGQRGPIQAPMGGTTRFSGHCYQSVQRAGALNGNSGQKGMEAKQGTI